MVQCLLLLFWSVSLGSRSAVGFPIASLPRILVIFGVVRSLWAALPELQERVLKSRVCESWASVLVSKIATTNASVRFCGAVGPGALEGGG